MLCVCEDVVFDEMSQKSRAGGGPPSKREPRASGEVVFSGAPGEQDLHFWNEGTGVRAYRTFGAHPRVLDGDFDRGNEYTEGACGVQRAGFASQPGLMRVSGELGTTEKALIFPYRVAVGHSSNVVRHQSCLPCTTLIGTVGELVLILGWQIAGFPREGLKQGMNYLGRLRHFSANFGVSIEMLS